MSGPRGPVLPPGSREEILARIFTLLGDVSGIAEVCRNRGNFEGVQLPALALLDGGHELVQEIRPGKTVQMPSALFTLKPGIVLITVPRATLSNLTLMVNGVEQPAPIGPELSAWEDKICATIENDPTLLSLLTTSGQIVYKGSDTDMQWGSSMLGGLQLHYDFTYVRVSPAS